MITTKLPSWEDARSLLNQFKGHALMTVAAKVCLGLTLQQLKEKEGYTHGSQKRFSKSADCGDGESPTWEDLVKTELGISDDTASRFIRAGFAVREKLKKIGGSPRLLSLLETPVQTLSIADAEQVQAAIRTATDGETLTSLLQEFRLIKLPPSDPTNPSAGGKAERRQYTEEQMAWDFAGGSVISELSKVRQGNQFQSALYTLPLSATEETPFGLIDYVAELRTAYETADQVLKTRLKS